VSAGARSGSLEARLYFPHLVSRGGSYFGSGKDPSGIVLLGGEGEGNLLDFWAPKAPVD
jgi:hypothetical protein